MEAACWRHPLIVVICCENKKDIEQNLEPHSLYVVDGRADVVPISSFKGSRRAHRTPSDVRKSAFRQSLTTETTRRDIHESSFCCIM